MTANLLRQARDEHGDARRADVFCLVKAFVSDRKLCQDPLMVYPGRHILLAREAMMKLVRGDAPCILTANSLGWYTVMFKGGCARARHCALPDRQHQERIPEACKASTKPLFQLRGGSEVLAAIVWGYRNAAPTTSTASVSWNANLVEPTCAIHEKRH